MLWILISDASSLVITTDIGDYKDSNQLLGGGVGQRLRLLATFAFGVMKSKQRNGQRIQGAEQRDTTNP